MGGHGAYFTQVGGAYGMTYQLPANFWADHAPLGPLFDAFEAAGHQLLFVGGFVRNMVMGLPPTDVDMATDARPDQVQQFATQAGLRHIPTGIDHGTITVMLGKTPVEITTFRKDVETDGRRAVVGFSDNIQDDAMRRDFTMNALYATRTGTVLDPLGRGLVDATARHVRFIGTPTDRLNEDYLRILRFFRFYAWFGGGRNAAGIDADGLAACADRACPNIAQNAHTNRFTPAKAAPMAVAACTGA